MAKRLIFSEPKSLFSEVAVKNRKGHDLGFLAYSPQWSQWLYYPTDNIQLSRSCMLEIVLKLEDLNH